ncbi:MAG: phosphoribosylformylglycinamidine synthase [Gammaproteobacteria bacterium]
MQVIYGRPALSDFRVQRHLTELRAHIPQLNAITTRFVYFCWFDDGAGFDERMLDLVHGTAVDDSDQQTQCIVIPRFGTVSPWSTKATDIAKQCGVRSLIKVERGVQWFFDGALENELKPATSSIHDRMTQSVIYEFSQATALHDESTPRPPQYIPLKADGIAAIERANVALGLALADDEIAYLEQRYQQLNRDPSDVELMMFAQANSEHCRHKIFNADWVIDGKVKDHSLFSMIRHTHEHAPNQVLSAYKDNSAVSTGYLSSRFFVDPADMSYRSVDEHAHILMKVETHNHPTGISPYPGASTGSGGEIRDEGATGRGAKPKAGLTGFSVSNLRIPDFPQAWEQTRALNPRLASAFEIMQQAPIGAASFNNEFGRPSLCGYFRSFEERTGESSFNGYDKPIMLAGGMGNIRPQHVEKDTIRPGDRIIVLGGPAMLIGLGGGAASSMSAGDSNEDLDFASVQRDNPEMERRCQEVINTCWSLGAINPVISIHDVGAGGLSNAVPEILHDSNRGGKIKLRNIPNADLAMSPLEIWCNEAQERYVVAIAAEDLERFAEICGRERCPYADIGEAIVEEHLTLFDALTNENVIDLPMDVIFGKPPKMNRDVTSIALPPSDFDQAGIKLDEAIDRVLQHPSVGDKRFLITIGDRNVGGLSVRDQMVGPWQVPVADCAVTAATFASRVGEAMALGERTPLAAINAPASGRMAIGEMITNLAAARIMKIEDIVVSANWMAAADHPGEDANLFATVKAVGLQLCPQLGIVIPVGKDSMSMKTTWHDDNADSVCSTTSPVSMIASGFAPVCDLSKSLTPLMRTDNRDSVLLLIDLGKGQNRLGGSILSQCFERKSSHVPDVDEPELIREFFTVIQLLNETGYIEAYHDRSDGGLITTLVEMAFASRSGLDIRLTADQHDILAALFAEELGAVIQVQKEHLPAIQEFIAQYPTLTHCVSQIATLNDTRTIRIATDKSTIYETDLFDLLEKWSATTFHMQALRDNPDCAKQEYETILNPDETGLFLSARFEDNYPARLPTPLSQRPNVAILREQGVNGQTEMAAAFDRAGFRAVDVHMSDLIAGERNLSDFKGLVACGGFSYGDVLGAGGGWAKSILYNPRLADMFSDFFNRDETFSLGVCNGCQMLAHLGSLIPGEPNWPRFLRNSSEQFEARLVMAKIEKSPSVLLKNMEESCVPIVVAHGEGRVDKLDDDANICLRYVDSNGEKTARYPANPNGSVDACAGLCSADGRVTIMMPHPERVFLTQQFSWLPEHWSQTDGPWMTMFDNARKFVI